MKWCFICWHRKNVAACAKHYVGDGGTTRGINENNTVINRHGLLSVHMAGYYTSIIKGVSTVMVSYSSWNGVKMHANRDMVTGFLKNTLRFRVNWVYFLALNPTIIVTLINCGLTHWHVILDRDLSFQIGKELTGSRHHLMLTTHIPFMLESMLVLTW